MSTLVPENEQQFGSLLTYLGESAEQNAKLLKKEIDFTHIAFGDANDTYVQPDRAQTSLVNELARIPINAIDVIQPDLSSPPILSVQAILPEEYNDIVIRELAVVSVFNGESYLHAVGNCARIYVPKPSNNGDVATPVTLEMLFVVTSSDPIVKIDPNLIVASRDYVNKIAGQITNEWFDGKVFPIRPDEYCSVGDIIKTGTIGVRVRNDDGEIVLCRMNQPTFGEVSNVDSKNFIIYFKDGKSTLLDPSYNTSSIRDIQKQNFNVFAKKIASDDGSEIIKIACRGDSLTEGEDELVGQREPDSDPTPSGRIHTKKRALTTYPEALAEFLTPVFQNQISVINQGFSGDNTKLGWNDWDEDVQADLTIIMYGTNDSAFGFSPYQTVEEFIHYYKLIVVREIKRGASVVLMTPPPQKQYNFNTRLLEAYRDAVFNLAEEFGLICLNGVEVFKNVDSTYFSDNVHFKDVGYKYLASKITSRILSNLKTPTSVFSGTNIVTRFNDDGIKFRFNQWGINLAKSGQNTPPLNSYSGGYVTETSQYNEYLYFSFYSEVDDLVITPNVNVTNAKLTVDLDHGLPQPQYTFDDRVWRDTSPNRDAKPASSVEVDALDKSIWLDRLSELDVLSSCRIHVATKGWHTIRFWIEDNGSVGAPTLTVAGLNFIDYETAKLIDDYRYKRRANQNPIGNVKPLYLGEEYLDESSGQHRWYKSTGLNVNDWKPMTSTPEDTGHSGAQSPVNNVTPRYLGDEYLDTSPGQYIWYKATGLTSSSWKPIN